LRALQTNTTIPTPPESAQQFTAQRAYNTHAAYIIRPMRYSLTSCLTKLRKTL